MSNRKRPREQTIFFPWERPTSLLGGRGLARAKPFAAALVMILVLLLLGARERRRTGIRSTRATLGVVAAAVDAAKKAGRPSILVGVHRQGRTLFLPIKVSG